MNDVLVSVAVVTYNQAEYICQALDSLRAQTLPAECLETIIVNDGSDDETPKLLKNYSAWARVVNQENQGLVAGCNTALALASGRYFARLDSDDFAEPHWLETLVNVLEDNPDACCAIPDRKELRQGVLTYIKTDPNNMYSLEACGTLFLTDSVRRTGAFRPFFWEEYDLYLRLANLGKFAYVPQALYVYRKHQGSMTEDRNKRLQGWIELAREWGGEILTSAGRNPDLEQALKLLEAKDA